MDALKLIPQLFYDLICRVLPGSVALVLLGLSTGVKLGKWITDFWEGATAIQGSVLWLGFGFLVAAYLVGQIISPISDFIENKLIKRLFPHYFKVLEIELSGEGAYSADMKTILSRELTKTDDRANQLSSSQYQKAVFVWYDWLRINSPQAGANAAKIRAEYRMHSQNTVVFIAALMTHLIWVATQEESTVKPMLIVLTIVAGSLSLWATARTYRTFQWAVIQQFYAVLTSRNAQE